MATQAEAGKPFSPPSAEKAEAQLFLSSLLNKKLRVHTTDDRMFWGDFKCTDPVCALPPPLQLPSTPLWLRLLRPTLLYGLRLLIASCSQDRNIVLAYTYEYRQPSAQQRALAAEESAVAGEKTVKMEMTHRYLGLVVVPGEHIVKIEKEVFASQIR